MPHPTPYSRQFDAIRTAFPGLFEPPASEAPPTPRVEGDEVILDSRSANKPDGKWLRSTYKLAQ